MLHDDGNPVGPKIIAADNVKGHSLSFQILTQVKQDQPALIRLSFWLLCTLFRCDGDHRPLKGSLAGLKAFTVCPASRFWFVRCLEGWPLMSCFAFLSRLSLLWDRVIHYKMHNPTKCINIIFFNQTQRFSLHNNHIGYKYKN